MIICSVVTRLSPFLLPHVPANGLLCNRKGQLPAGSCEFVIVYLYMFLRFFIVNNVINNESIEKQTKKL